MAGVMEFEEVKVAWPSACWKLEACWTLKTRGH
jgi:hypothetical protein